MVGGIQAIQRSGSEAFPPWRLVIFSIDKGQDLLEILAVGIQQGPGAARDDVAAGDAEGRKPGEPDGYHTGPAVLNADDVVTVAERDAQTHAAHLGVEPRMRFGRELAQRAHLAHAQRKTGGDDRIVELLRVPHLEGLKRRNDLGPGLLVESGGHQPDPDAALLEGQQELLQARGGLEGARTPAPFHDRPHLPFRDFEVITARLLHFFLRAVLVNAVLEVLAHAVAGNVRPIRGCQPKLLIAEEARHGAFDDPDPEFLAAHAGAVQVHEHRPDGTLDVDRKDRIKRGISQFGFHPGQRVPLEEDEIRLSIAGGEDFFHPIFPNLETALRRGLPRDQPFGIGQRPAPRQFGCGFHRGA